MVNFSKEMMEQTLIREYQEEILWYKFCLAGETILRRLRYGR